MRVGHGDSFKFESIVILYVSCFRCLLKICSVGWLLLVFPAFFFCLRFGLVPVVFLHGLVRAGSELKVRIGAGLGWREHVALSVDGFVRLRQRRCYCDLVLSRRRLRSKCELAPNHGQARSCSVDAACWKNGCDLAYFRCLFRSLLVCFVKRGRVCLFSYLFIFHSVFAQFLVSVTGPRSGEHGTVLGSCCNLEYFECCFHKSISENGIQKKRKEKKTKIIWKKVAVHSLTICNKFIRI